MTIFSPGLYKIKLPALLFAILLSLQSPAQEPKALQLELEADPLAYLLKGYSFHVGTTYGNFRSSVGVFGISQPDFFTNNDAFDSYSSGFDFKTDYLFTGVKGFHAGLQFTYGKEKLTLKTHSEKADMWGLSAGLRAGYRFMLGKSENKYKGVYVNPWLAFIYTPKPGEVIIRGETYRQSRFAPFPAIHVGMRF